ncbi:MAG: flagellar basal body P-ring formation chaperone FlgA [Gammaproteobacteria bacterium]
MAAVLAALFSSGTTAEGLQSPESIRQAAQEIAEQSVGNELEATSATTASVNVGQVDPRLHLPACSEALEGFLPSNVPARTNLTVGVRCNGSSPWTVYVPVQVSVMRPVVVLARPVPRGTVLSAEDIRMDSRNVGTSAGYFDDSASVIGKVLIRSGNAGQVINPTQLTSSTAIKRGQQVTLSAGSGAVAVKMSGTAMADAAVGDRLKVKNNTSARVVEGVVQPDGSVAVDL